MARDQVLEVKEKTDVVALVSQYVSLKKSGKNHKGLCPFHNEKTPSFMVSPELGIWKCFGCGEGGDVYSFLMKMEGMEFSEALETLAQKAGVKLESYRRSPEEDRKKRLLGLNHRAAEYFHYLLTKHQVGHRALKYLHQERGFDDELIAEFNLGYAPNSWDSLGSYLLSKDYTLSELIESGLVVSREGERKFYDRFRGRVMFPLRDHRGRVVGFSGRVVGKGPRLSSGGEAPKYINTPETPVFRKGRFLYGLFETKTFIRREGRAIVVEGPIDFLTPFAFGTKNIVAAQGTALTLEQIKLLQRYTEDIAICFDTDLAGDAAAKRGIALAEQVGLNVSVVPLPGGCKDPDDCVRQEPDSWEKSVSSPVPIYDFYFSAAFKRYSSGDPIGRKKIARELLPIIKAIPNEIERASYVQRLADDLGVEHSVVARSLAKAASHSGAGPSLSVVGSISDEGDGGLGTYPQREIYMLSILLLGSLDHVKAVVHRLGREDFSHPLLREFFNHLKKYLLQAKVFRVKNFSAKMKDNKALVSLLGDISLRPVLLDSDQIEDELEVALANLKRERVKRELKELGRKLREKEQERDLAAVERLQREFRDLSEKLL